jgi:putative addiction module component (TIGR02574 family)
LAIIHIQMHEGGYMVNRSFDFTELTAAERLTLAQELLDSVADDLHSPTSGHDSMAPFTAEQMAEIRRRAADADAGRITGEPWEVVRVRLNSR